MSFLRDKRQKRLRQKVGLFSILGILFLVVFLIWGSGPVVQTGLIIAEPFWKVSNRANGLIEDSYTLATASKGELLDEVENLKKQINLMSVLEARLGVLEQENRLLRESLGYVWPDEKWVLAGVIARPPVSPYDVLILDVGTEQGISVGQLVLTGSGSVVGSVQKVFNNKSIVSLFSTPGKKTSVVMFSQGVGVEALGKGGGVYQVFIPRNINVNTGDIVVLPGGRTEVIGQVGEVMFDARDPFQIAYVSSFDNIYEQRLVYVSSRSLDDIPAIETFIFENLTKDLSNAEAESTDDSDLTNTATTSQ